MIDEHMIMMIITHRRSLVGLPAPRLHSATNSLHRTFSMTSATPAPRSKFLKRNGYNNTVSSQDCTHTLDQSSPQLTFKCLDDTESPSSSEDDPSDTNTDESDDQGLAGGARAPSSMEQVVHEVDAENPRQIHKKSSRRTSFWTELDLSIIIALIAPLVNWLTGSDHLKSLFLVLFLIIYLHQLVQGALHSCFDNYYVANTPLKSHGNFITPRAGGTPTLPFVP